MDDIFYQCLEIISNVMFEYGQETKTLFVIGVWCAWRKNVNFQIENPAFSQILSKTDILSAERERPGKLWHKRKRVTCSEAENLTACHQFCAHTLHFFSLHFLSYK